VLCHEDVWGTGGTAPLILNLHTIRRRVVKVYKGSQCKFRSSRDYVVLKLLWGSFCRRTANKMGGFVRGVVRAEMEGYRLLGWDAVV
jgi:hypothetical protein